MPQKRTASFSIIVGFIVLMIIGLALLPKLSVHLHSNRYIPTLYISYGWNNASPRLIEQEVTAPLEGLFNTIVGVQKIKSTSNRGSGRINLEFDEHADMDNKRFEIASRIREAYPSFPAGVSYPRISPYEQESEEKTLLSYTLNAAASPRLIQEFAEDHIVPKLAHIDGLYRVHVYGATPMEWELTYDQEQLWTLGIDYNQIVSALQGYFRLEVIGMGMDSESGEGTPKPIIVRAAQEEGDSWLDIPVTEVNGRVLRVRDLCQVIHKEQEPTGYYRINGNNTINIRCTAEVDANSLKVAADLKNEMQKLEEDFPPGYFLLMTDDQTEYIKDQLNKIYYRTLFSFTILLLFVLLISRQIRYLLIIFISLIANLLTAFILYYLLKVQINLYSLAGITVSLGLIIDNTIVMLDHMRTKGNRRVFMAILAATLTTMGALSVIRFFGQEIQEWLIDFTWVLVINLFVSLMVALFLVPSLFEKIPLRKKDGRRSNKRRMRVIRFTYLYERVIRFAQRYRWVYIVFAILLFGLPIYMAPTRMEGEEWYHKLYQKTFASNFYVQKLKPVVDKSLGGTLRLFTNNVVNRYKYRYPERTQIYVRASLPEGAVLQQMNDLMVEIERYLGQYEQIDQYVTTIQGARSGRMTITFKDEYEMGAFPYVLYSQLNDLANKEGGADWSIQGVGQYFNNSVSETTGSQRIILRGFNFEDLVEYADWTLNEALKNGRVQKGSVISFMTYRRDPLYEYVLRMNPELMESYGMNSFSIMQELRANSISNNPSGSIFIDGDLEPIRMKSKQSDEFDVWMMGNSPVQHEQNMVKLTDLGRVKRENQSRTIQKDDQQYVLIVEYEYIGASKLAQMHQEQLISRVKDHLPIGFSATSYRYYYQREKPKSQFLMILLVMVIIYLICSILLESLKQPLAVVLIIPVSFVGVFLTFYFSEFSFDQGGFASFLLLSGIVVNASLYILNDFNNLTRAGRYKNDEIKRYLKAFNGKIIPIFLTVMSTVLGLTPFLAGGDDSTFWFSLAVGTMGGLIFSVLALIIFLPAFMKLKRTNESGPGQSPAPAETLGDPISGRAVPLRRPLIKMKTSNTMKNKANLLLFIILILLGSCKPKDENQYGNELGKTEAKADPVYVEGVIAVLGEFPLEFISNGKLQAANEAGLFFEKQGMIRQIKVKNGDWVKKGQVLGVLENAVDAINLKQAEFQVESAELEYQDKLMSHTAGGVNEDLTTDEARNYFELSSGLKNARLNLEKAQMDYEHSILKAPFEGRIADLEAKENNMPSGADPFCRVIDDRNFEVLFPVLESEIGRLKVGQKITMRTFVNDTVFYAGAITEINPVVDEHGLVTVKARVPNRDRRLIQGMNVKVFIKDMVPNSLIVPKEAVVLRNNRQVVFTYSEGKAMWNYIHTVLENSTSYSIIRDAQEVLPGDTVITVGNLNLAHEAEVKFKMIQ